MVTRVGVSGRGLRSPKSGRFAQGTFPCCDFVEVLFTVAPLRIAFGAQCQLASPAERSRQYCTTGRRDLAKYCDRRVLGDEATVRAPTHVALRISKGSCVERRDLLVRRRTGRRGGASYGLARSNAYRSGDGLEMANQLAVVTGASSGIGYKLAKVFAENGYDLVIVSTGERLEKAAVDFQALGVQVKAIEADLASMTA